MSTRPSQRISPAELRRIFNEDHIWGRAQSGEFIERVLSSRPAPANAGEPFGTESQIVAYHENWGSRRRVAVIHQYLRPDGYVGGRGRPDPKALWKDGVLLIASTELDPPGSA